MAWQVNGQYFESCNCDTACPCVFLSPPTDGECTALVGWHIESGEYEGVSVDGLNVALAAYSPGHMVHTPWQAALYLDNRADDAQSGALAAVFSGQAGGHPARLGAHIGEVLGAGPAAIEFTAEGKQRTMKVEGVADVSITAIPGQGDADITIENHPLCIAPGFKAVAARSDHLSYSDHEMTWELSGKNGFYSPFAYSG